MQISIDAAKSFASSGFDKVLQEATKVSDTVAEVDFVQGARTLAQKTDQAMQRGVHEVRSLPGKRPKVRDMVNAIEQRMQVSNITGAASTKARALGQDLQPGLKKTAAALQPGLERTAQAVEIAKERAGEFAEQMKPRIIEAHENAKKKICKAASEAAATAAWFQTQHTCCRSQRCRCNNLWGVLFRWMALGPVELGNSKSKNLVCTFSCTAASWESTLQCNCATFSSIFATCDD